MFENVKAYTEVNVNELSRILIRGDKTFVEKDGQTQLEIVGYDSDGTQFDLSLFKMNF